MVTPLPFTFWCLLFVAIQDRTLRRAPPIPIIFLLDGSACIVSGLWKKGTPKSPPLPLFTSASMKFEAPFDILICSMWFMWPVAGSTFAAGSTRCHLLLALAPVTRLLLGMKTTRMRPCECASNEVRMSREGWGGSRDVGVVSEKTQKPFLRQIYGGVGGSCRGRVLKRKHKHWRTPQSR